MRFNLPRNRMFPVLLFLMGLFLGVLILIAPSEMNIRPAVAQQSQNPSADAPLNPALNNTNTQDILWSTAGRSTVSQWNLNNGARVFTIGPGQVRDAGGVTFNGHPAIGLTLTDVNGAEQSAQLFRWKDNPEQGYYSVWMNLPQHYKPTSWWNIFEFSSGSDPNADPNDAIWVLNVGNLPNGDMSFYLWDQLHQQSYTQQSTGQPLAIPVGCWTYVEAFYRRATQNTGQITIWQDGIKLLDLTGVQTAKTDSIQWGIGSYTDGIAPSTATFYVADAMVTQSRVNPTTRGICPH